MKNFKRQTFLPDRASLLLLMLVTFSSFTTTAAENPDYARYEKVFDSLEMQTIEATKMKLKDLPSPIVIVNFWASWCIPCLHEMPSLISLSSKYSTKELTVVAINTDEDDQLKNIDKIKKKLNFPSSFVIVPDKKFKIADEFKFSAIPVTVIFKKGKVIYFNNGPVDFLKLPVTLL